MEIKDQKRKLIISCIAWALTFDCVNDRMQQYRERFTVVNNDSCDLTMTRNLHIYAALNLTLSPEEIEMEDKGEFYFIFSGIYAKYSSELKYRDLLHNIGVDTDIANKILIEWESTLKDLRSNNNK